MNTTSIQWTDMSVNPIRAALQSSSDSVLLTATTGHYCEKVSPGCANCYASRLQPRFQMPTFEQAKARGHVTPFFDPSRLRAVLTRRKPTRIFWCDMTDLFGSWVPDEWIDQCFAVMALTPQHTHQVLTKRPGRMRQWSIVNSTGGRIFHVAQQIDQKHIGALSGRWPLPNVWLGVSCEDQPRADERIPLLLQTPAAVRFVSAEPLLGPIDLLLQTRKRCYHDVLRGFIDNEYPDQPRQPTAKLDWVIVGGESGPGSRFGDGEWIRSIVTQCAAASVPVFVKQMGTRPHLKDRKGGDPSEWPEDLRVREMPS